MFSGYFLAAISQFKGKNLHGKRQFSRLQLSVILLIITNVPMALYMSLFHQVSPSLCVYVLTLPCFWCLSYYFVRKTCSMKYFVSLLPLISFPFQDLFSPVDMFLYSYLQFLLWQRGTEDVMFYLSKEAHNGRVKGVLFLMPCHSTPYYSTLHSSLPMRFLDCTPRWLS